MKAYLSGPMSGLPSYNAPEFEIAAKELREQGIEVVSPIELDRLDGCSINDPYLSNKYWKFLGRDIQIIGEGNFDAVVVLPGWELSKGARLEIFTALLLGIPVLDMKLRTYSRTYLMLKLSESIGGEIDGAIC